MSARLPRRVDGFLTNSFIGDLPNRFPLERRQIVGVLMVSRSGVFAKYVTAIFQFAVGDKAADVNGLRAHSERKPRRRCPPTGRGLNLES